MQEDHSPLEARIEAELARSRQRIADFQEKAERNYEEMERRRDEFKAAAGDLLVKSGRPIEKLARHFENAEVHRSDSRKGRHVEVRFKHTPRFPATVELRFDVTHDEEIRKVIVLYGVSILPVFFDYERSDHISFDLDAVDEDRLKQWIDDKVVSFLQTYLRIQFAEEYQHENLVTDPVARVRFSRVFAKASVEYRGHTYYFVSDESREDFEQDPESWVRG